LERHEKRDGGAQWCRFHLENIDFHNRVREGYRSMAAQEAGRLKLIDASGSIEEVQRAVWSVCEEAGI
jgi:dTMP kinase